MSVDAAPTRTVAGRRRWRWAFAAGIVIVAAGLGAHALAGTGSTATNPTIEPGGSPPGSATGALAPNGTFTIPSGTTATIDSLRGRPTMVWFVAGGCASCAASIPAVATHLDQLRAAGLTVLTLGLYGDFAPGVQGVTQLLSFGQEATLGKPVTRPGWEWGMASKRLSLAYDPAGIPDLYVLIGPRGHIRYRNSVPVSTMGTLLSVAKHLETHGSPTAALKSCC